jgi:hypothetical protein
MWLPKLLLSFGGLLTVASTERATWRAELPTLSGYVTLSVGKTDFEVALQLLFDGQFRNPAGDRVFSFAPSVF